MGSGLARTAALVGGLAAATLLAACTSTTPAINEGSPTATATATAIAGTSAADLAPLPSSVTNSDGEGSVYLSSPTTGTRTPVDAACAPHVQMMVLGSGTEDDAYFEYVTPYDLGSRELAQGQVVLDTNGTVIQYIVASGDAPGAIAERLCSTLPMLYHDDAGLIYPGEVMDFGAEGIAAVRAKWWP